jgi:Na+/H+-dicarboxylate symporter
MHGTWRRRSAACAAVVATTGLAVAASGHPPQGYLLSLAGLALLCFTTQLSLSAQIAIAAGGALAFAVAREILGFDAAFESRTGVVALVGKVFVDLLRMVVGPLIFLSIAAGIGRMAADGGLGRLGLRLLALYVATMAAAVLVGLLVVNVLQPGRDSVLLQSAYFTAMTPPAAETPDLAQSITGLLGALIQSPVAALASGQILPIVFFALLLGIAIAQLGHVARPLLDMLDAGQHAVLRIVSWIVRLAPIGVAAFLYALLAGLRLGETAGEAVGELLYFIFVVFLATSIHAFIILPLFAWRLAAVPPRRLFAAIGEAMSVAFSTSSSAATLPVTTRNVQENLGVPPHIASVALPLGATVNMDGTALYEAIAAIFVAAVFGIELSFGTQAALFLIAMVAAMGAPGIPSAGMVTMVAVLETVGLPAQAIGLLLPIDRVLDTIRTMANVEGDAVVAACLAHLERSRDGAKHGAQSSEHRAARIVR